MNILGGQDSSVRCFQMLTDVFRSHLNFSKNYNLQGFLCRLYWKYLVAVVESCSLPSADFLVETQKAS